MNEQGVIAFIFAVIGSAIIGSHFESLWLSIGVYLCVVAAGRWPE